MLLAHSVLDNLRMNVAEPFVIPERGCKKDLLDVSIQSAYGDTDSLLKIDAAFAQQLRKQKENEISLQNKMLDNRWKAALERAKVEEMMLKQQEEEAAKDARKPRV